MSVSKDSGLYIDKAPKAFADIAAKHNALVRAIKSLKGIGGVTVTVSDSNILISVSASSSYVEGAAVDAVGSDGKLNKVVKHSTWVAPTTYPTILKAAGGTNSVTIDTASLAHDLTLREIDVCDAGIPKKMLILGSATY